MMGLIAFWLLVANILGFRHLLPVSWQTIQLTTTNHVLIMRPPADTSATPISTGSILAPAASAAYVIDIDSGQVLYQKNAHETRPIASITKLITALTILKTHETTEVVTVPTLPVYGPADDVMGLRPGMKFYVRDLMAASLIKSANDAAEALAIWDAGSMPKFAAKMNSTMTEWGIAGTHFVSASGLVDKDNYASAEAVAKIASLALASDLIAKLVDTPSLDVTSLEGAPFHLSTTNDLLQDNRFHGIKTGYTLAAGQSFVGLATLHGHRVISVILNSPDRFGETANLINQIEGATRWQTVSFQSSPL